MLACEKSYNNKASKGNEKSGMQQRVQEDIYSSANSRGAESCGRLGILGATAQQEVSGLRRELLSELLLLPDTSSQRPLLGLISKELEQMPIVYIAGPYSADPENCLGRAMVWQSWLYLNVVCLIFLISLTSGINFIIKGGSSGLLMIFVSSVASRPI